jgi:ABC-type multidrug transport system ATPase subunit
MNPSNSFVLETRDLSKAYKGVQALKEFNLKLNPGILGLLGPNGAGKSTLMRMRRRAQSCGMDRMWSKIRR